MLLPQSQCPNLSESADNVGGPMRRDKECPFSGVTNYGRVWRKDAGKRGLECGVMADEGAIPASIKKQKQK